MTIQIDLNIGTEVRNTNNTLFRILATDRPTGAPIVAMDVDSGEVQFFYNDGVPDNILHAALVLSIAEEPINDVNPQMVVEVGRQYRTRGGQRVTVEEQKSAQKWKVTHNDYFFDFGYEVWRTGMRNDDGSPNDDDIVQLWDDPQTFFSYIVSKRTDPFNKANWTVLTQRPEAIAGDEILFAVYFREPLTTTQTFDLVVKTP